MKDFEKINPGETKVNEYVTRIEAGEDREKILKDLPNSFRSAIEKKIPQHFDKEKKTEEGKFEVPPQYKGLPSFVLDEILFEQPHSYEVSCISDRSTGPFHLPVQTHNFGSITYFG